MELDYIIVSARRNIVQNCRVYRSADCGNSTDHRLVADTCSLRLKRCSLPQDTSPPIAVEKLLNPTTQRNFVLKLHNQFALLSESDESALSIENLWKEGRNALKETSHAVLGLCRRKKHQWISDEALGTIDEHRTARLCGNKVLARRLVTKRKQQLRRDETAWYSRIADEAEDANRTGNSAVPYHPHTHRPDCIQATTCDCQGPTPRMERPLSRTVQQPCSTTRSSPHGRSCQCPQSILLHQWQTRYRLQSEN